MFIEPNLPMGSIEVICGSMFSGKTEELIRRLKRAQIAGQRIALFKPEIDTRYQKQATVSHNGLAFPAEPVTSAQQILLLAGDAQVVALDEAQFFNRDVVEVVNQLADKGKRVIVAGLDMDFQGRPFGPMPYLMAVAEFVTKLHAICARTGMPASYSHRKAAENKTVLLGAQDEYEPVSRAVYVQLRKP